MTYIFTAGRWDIDRTRAYLPLDQAQTFFNRDGLADEIEVMTADPDAVDALVPAVLFFRDSGYRRRPTTP